MSNQVKVSLQHPFHAGKIGYVKYESKTGIVLAEIQKAGEAQKLFAVKKTDVEPHSHE